MSEFDSFPYSVDEELHAHRYTSETVLTTGAEQGWADPQDPEEVDFSLRPSLQGDYVFDFSGRPLNPRRTPAMLGDRGELGKWAVNNTADPVVVALAADGRRHIFLIRRSDTGQWALPGGMVDPGEHASQTAKRELYEEAGIDLSDIPAKVIYQGYVDDPRNTRNAWVETTASLLIVHHTPQPQANPQEARDARWFDFDTTEHLIQQTGGLYASHSQIVEQAAQVLDTFDYAMRTAQDLHGKGEFEQAQKLWREAADLMPDPIEKGRAIRGFAASSDRLDDYETALVHAETALALHTNAVRLTAESAWPQAVRERSQSTQVVGRLMLGNVVRKEIDGQLSSTQARELALSGVAQLDMALEDITEVEAATGGIDQHRINLLSRLAIAHAVYGDAQKAKAYAHESAILSWKTESKHAQTSADISASYRWRAKGRALPRALAAITAARLATVSHSRRRTMALSIARDPRFGL